MKQWFIFISEFSYQNLKIQMLLKTGRLGLTRTLYGYYDEIDN